MKSHIAIGIFGWMAVLGATGASAKTVALWPMETDLRCEVDSYLTLTAGKQTGLATTKALPWAVPPNPDTDRHLAEIANSAALWSSNNVGGAIARISNANLAAALCSTSDFTLEGWINVQDIPASNGWYIIANVDGGSGASGGWIWSMRRQSRSQGYTDFELFVYGLLSDNCLGNAWFEEPADQTNRWMHVAMTHRQSNAQGKSEWNMYTNGVLWGTVAHTASAKITPANQVLELGGRESNTANRFRGGLDYWRVSNRVLEPGEFLCAGGTGSAIASDPSPTAYYWKLDRAADGTVDGSPSVGLVPLSGGFPTLGVASPGRYHPSTDSAFSGNPPNTTVTLSDGNCGSFYAPDVGNQWRIDGLGAQLEITNDFTVEGWFKPERCRNDGSTVQYMFNTRIGEGGWALGLQRPVNSSTWRLQLFAQQTNLDVLVGNVNLSPELSDWADWKHLALTYDHAAADGKGVWSCYLDGVRSGVATNSIVPTETTGSQNFHIGGRVGTPTTFHGRVDCVRVSRGVLDPRQFLCAATDCQAVPEDDVLAFWPLDVKRGAYICGDDLKGNYSFQPASTWTDARMVGTVADAPVIANPDRTWGFAGSPTNLSGSAAFWTTANNNASTCELSAYSVASRFFRTRPGWTAEFYVKRTAGTPTNWELLLGAATDLKTDGAGMCLNFTYRSNGFVLLDSNINCYLWDTAFSGTSGNDLPEGRWAHVALTFQTNVVDGVAKAVYEVFVDGASKGTVSANLKSPSANEKVLLLGGRLHSSNSFKGYISSLRLSSRVLAPSEFLCGTASASAVTNTTVANWPLDFDGTTLDVGSRVLAGAAFSEVVGATGATERAVARVPRGDASAEFEGDPRANTGSVVLTGTGSRLVVTCLGLRADVDRPFTVEGWFKWAKAADLPYPREVICGTYRPGVLKGWKLYLDRTGTTPCVRLMVMPGYPYSRLVDDAVLVADASDWEKTWKHLALVYDVHAGARGVWTLWVDGKAVGCTENLWSPQGVACQTDLFGLGAIPVTSDSTTAAGGYDLWRLSEGALTADEFLYKVPSGTVVFLR